MEGTKNLKIDKSMWMLIFGFVLCAGCSPLQSAAENDLFKADADFRKGEVALKNSEPSKALIYLSAAVARYKNEGPLRIQHAKYLSNMLIR